MARIFRKLAQLLDVDVTSTPPNDGDRLTFDAGSETWVPHAGSGGGGAPTDATYITQTANGDLDNEQALSALSTGLVKVTNGTGVLSTATGGTDYANASHQHAGEDITSGTVADARIASTIARDSEVTSAISALSSVYQAKDTTLDTYAGIDPSSNVQSVLSAADYASIRTLLGLVIGTNVQAYDADLTTYAGITPSSNVQSLLGAADYAAMRTLLDVPTNAAAILDALIDAKGDLLVGTAADTVTRLPVGGTDGHVLTVDSGQTAGIKWAAASGGSSPSIVTSLPGSPSDGDEVYLKVGSGDAAVLWHMKYDSSISDSYKWRFLGGPRLSARQNTAGNTTSGSYTELNSGTPAVTLPGIGIYEFAHGWQLGASVNPYGIQNVKTNGSNPVTDNDAAISKMATNQVSNMWYEFERTVSSISTSASAVLVYRTDGSDVSFIMRYLGVRPVRLG